jgi:hypothetical protein
MSLAVRQNIERIGMRVVAIVRVVSFQKVAA